MAQKLAPLKQSSPEKSDSGLQLRRTQRGLGGIFVKHKSQQKGRLQNIQNFFTKKGNLGVVRKVM